MKSNRLAQIATELNDSEKILNAVRAEKGLRTNPSSIYTPPRTPTEVSLANIWAEVLGLDRVGLDDDFFDLGGHSLLATQVASRVRQALEVELSLTALFEAPTVAGLAEYIQAARREVTVLPLQAAPYEGELPLSFAQERLWFLDQVTPGSPVYNIPLAVCWRGPLKALALQQSLNEIVQRHEALRTVFTVRAGHPVQVILTELSLPLAQVNLCSLSASDRKTELKRLIVEEACQPFTLSRGPLMRAKLLHLATDDYLLLLTLHHIIADGWSLEVLSQELSALYQKYTAAMLTPLAPVKSPLPALPVQYADYVVWQRTWLQREVLEAELAYWRERLADLPVLELPTDRPRPPVQSFQGASVTFTLPASLSAALIGLSQQEHVTLFMVLLAAFQVLLYRYTRQTDIAVGTPVANRTQVELERLIGFFVNTLVLRVDLSGEPSFRELLKRVRQVALEAYAHQELPFEKLVEVLRPERDLSRQPLVQVIFVLRNAPSAQSQIPEVALHSEEIENGTAKFDLTLLVTEIEGEFVGRFEYCADLFDRATIERLYGHWQTLLEAVVLNPDLFITQLPLLTPAERQQVLVEWNATEAVYPAVRCVSELFEAQMARTPDAIAVVFENQQLTYAELNDRAEQLAHQLDRMGVGPDVLVGVCLERSLEMVVSLLAVLKAGGAYLPLDPAYPLERLAYMLADARIEVLITESRLLGVGGWRLVTPTADQPLAANRQLPITICLDTEWETITTFSQQLATSNQQPVSPDNLIYIIYTSGSTGRPKGAMNSHRGLYNRLRWMQDAYQLIDADRVLQKTPFSFDVSGWEFFWPLITGACLVMARPGGHQDSTYLKQLIIQEHITTLHYVPSMLQIFLEEPGVEACRSLQRVICSGEALPAELVERFYQRFSPAPELHNLYGPTEAAIDVTAWACEPDPERRSIPIGRPIANTQTYILNAQMQPVPIGVPGELYLGGVGLGRGYLDRPELTAERFIPNPFARLVDGGPLRETEDGRKTTSTVHRLAKRSSVDLPSTVLRLYKTGDLARYLPDGNIEFLGRLDHQVKVRGYRIELGEIEAVLHQHPAIRECVAVVRGAEASEKQLIAYVVSSTTPAPSVNELRNFLKARLPNYMLPSLFVFMEALPLTPNGKVDRRALPAPTSDRPHLENAYVPPQSDLEQTIAAVWKAVLSVDQVGLNDNFFDLGGHSLLLSQVHHQLQAVLKKDLTLVELFQYPTVGALAEYLRQGETGEPTAIQQSRAAAQARRESIRQREDRRDQGRIPIVPTGGAVD